MKKLNILGISALLLGTLTACESVNSGTKEPTPVELGVAALQENYKVTYELKQTRSFESYFYSFNPTVKTTTITHDYKYNDEHTIVKVNSSKTSQTDSEEKPAKPVEETLVYDDGSGIVLNEFLNYKNEPEFRPKFNDGTSRYYRAESELGFNHLKSLEASDFVVDEATGKISCSSDVVEDVLYSINEVKTTATSWDFKVENGKFTEFTASFEPLKNYYCDAELGGESYVDAFELKATFAYTPSAVTFVKPKQNKKDAAFDAIINKFDVTKNNFTLKGYTGDVSESTARNPFGSVMYDGEKLVLDLGDFMSANEIGTYSLYDSCLYTNENGKQYFKCLDYNWDTFELTKVLNMEQATANSVELPQGETFPDLDDNRYLLDKGLFNLDFANIDSSIFEKDEKGNLVLTGNDAQYFGESIVTRVYGFTPVKLVLNVNYSQLRFDGESWKIKVEKDSILFVGTYFYDAGGKKARGTYTFELCDIGTTDVKKFYDEFAKLEAAQNAPKPEQPAK